MPHSFPEIILVCEDDSLAKVLSGEIESMRPGSALHHVNPSQPQQWDQVVRKTMDKPRVALIGVRCKQSVTALALRTRPFSESIPWLVLLHPDMDATAPQLETIPYAKVKITPENTQWRQQLATLVGFLQICQYP